MNMDQAEQLFINEAEELLAQMEFCLLEVDGGAARIEDHIDEIFRAAHTIKGSAGLFGFDDIVAFTHNVESVLDRVRAGEIDFTSDLSELIFDCHRHMSVLIAVLKGSGERSLETEERLTVALAAYMSNGNKAADQTHGELAEPAENEREQRERCWHVFVQYGIDTFRDGMDPSSHINYLKTLGSIESLSLSERLPDEDFDAESCYLELNLWLTTIASRDDILEVFEFIQEYSTVEVTEKTDSISLASTEAVTHAPDVSVEGSLPNATVADDSERKKTERPVGDVSFLKVDARKLDHLIGLIGEMVTSGAAIELMIRHLTDTRVSEAFSGMVDLVEQVRDGALQLRMVQVGETFSRLRRIVRDVAKETGKGIDLNISGSETELDKTMVDKLGDPLMHIVRNAIDHGIESVENRLAAGKPKSGSLHLNAYHDSGSVVIEVSDDGAGLDAERIYRKALDRGLIEEGKKPSDEEIYKLIFSPGFSTAEAVTKLSGRGVGMDVVKRNIDDLKGLIEISSEKGKGTRFRIRLPLTLAIIDSFEVSVRDTHLVIPTSMIKECIGFDRNKLCIDRNFINLRGEVLPFVRVSEVFSYDGINTNNDPVIAEYIDDMLGDEKVQKSKEHLIVVQFADKRAGLVVDELLGEVQAVVKPISALFRSIRGISGTTILGTGDVGFIIDVPQFIEFSRDTESQTINRNLLNVMRT